ncbi:MAG: hypothetical protein HYV13_01710 [Candidatus Doudnabacteria bacterium]|nr:hypothetical protein [Candidatus Doudnabacteria bacterium]
MRNTVESNSAHPETHHTQAQESDRLLTEPLTELERLAIQRVQFEHFPYVYPYEAETVHELVEDIKRLWESGVKKKELAGYLLRVAEAYRQNGVEGVWAHIYRNLDRMINEITSGQVGDFDKYRDIENGDSAIALLARYGGSLELVEQSCPELKRDVIYPEGQAEHEGANQGVVLFICGYGATTTPYKGIFRNFRLPVVAYQLPHSVIGEKPEQVAETFNKVRQEILKDPLIDKVTHVMGNSIGTMLASRLSIDLCHQNPDRKIQTALVQVGTSWQDALARTNAKFAAQLRERLARQGLSFKDFDKVLRQFNPIDLTDDLSELLSHGQLDLSMFIGLGDKMISPAREAVDPLLEKLDSSKAKDRYNAYISKVAGHNSVMLMLLWLMSQKATEWAVILKSFDLERDKVETAKAERYHARKKISRPEEVLVA